MTWGSTPTSSGEALTLSEWKCNYWDRGFSWLPARWGGAADRPFEGRTDGLSPAADARQSAGGILEGGKVGNALSEALEDAPPALKGQLEMEPRRRILRRSPNSSE